MLYKYRLQNKIPLRLLPNKYNLSQLQVDGIMGHPNPIIFHGPFIFMSLGVTQDLASGLGPSQSPQRCYWSELLSSFSDGKLHWPPCAELGHQHLHRMT